MFLIEAFIPGQNLMGKRCRSQEEHLGLSVTKQHSDVVARLMLNFPSRFFNRFSYMQPVAEVLSEIKLRVLVLSGVVIR